MTQFTVDSEQVMAANSAIQSTIARLQGEVDTLHAQLINLNSSWTGLAANSFQDLASRWRQTAASVEAQLGELGNALAHAANQYSEIEYANQRLFL
jgi:WXG100 family type VII secretion target